METLIFPCLHPSIIQSFNHSFNLSIIKCMEYIQDRYYKLSPKELLSELKTSFDGLTKQDIATREKIYGKNMLI